MLFRATPGGVTETQLGYQWRLARANAVPAVSWILPARTPGLNTMRRICMICLLDWEKPWKVCWDTDPIPICQEHGLWLINECKTCERGLSLKSLLTTGCRCGQGLEGLARSQTAASERFQIIAATTPTEVMTLVGALDLFGLQNKVNKKLASKKLSVHIQCLEHGAAILRAGDEALNALFDRIRDEAQPSGTVYLLNQAMPSLLHILGSIRDVQWRRRLTDSLNEYVKNTWGTNRPIVGRNTARGMTLKSTAGALGCSAKTVARKLGDAPVRVTAAGRQRRALNLGSIQRVLADERGLHTFSVKAAARTLSISTGRVRVLLESGHLVMDQKSIQAISVASAARALWTERPDAKVGGECRDMVDFSEALRRQVPVRLTGHLFEAIIAGEMHLETNDSKKWGIDESKLKLWVKVFETEGRRPPPEDQESSEQYFSIPEVAIQLGVKQEVAYHLVRSGLLKSVIKRLGKRPARFMTMSGLEEFNERYEFLVRAAAEVGIHRRHAMKWAIENNRKFQAGPSIDGCRQYLMEKC